MWQKLFDNDRGILWAMYSFGLTITCLAIGAVVWRDLPAAPDEKIQMVVAISLGPAFLVSTFLFMHLDYFFEQRRKRQTPKV